LRIKDINGVQWNINVKWVTILFTILLLISTTSSAQLVPNAQESTEFSVDFGGSTTKSYSNFTSIKPDLPNIGDYVQTNVSDFSSDGTAEYSGNQVVTEVSQQIYEITITLTKVEIIGPDKDGTLQGAGDIFVEGYANGN